MNSSANASVLSDQRTSCNRCVLPGISSKKDCLQSRNCCFVEYDVLPKRPKMTVLVFTWIVIVGP